MTPPADTELPLFTYGLFRPGQIAHFQIRAAVDVVEENVRVRGDLWVRDGLPLLDPHGYGECTGALVWFRKGDAAEAYDAMTSMNLGKQYRWGTIQVDGKDVNVLIGRSLQKGSDPMEAPVWDGWQDPLFTSALDVVGDVLANADDFDLELKSLFRLQMAYLLLWSSIERYGSLRYDLGNDVMAKLRRVATEEEFGRSLRQRVHDQRRVQSAKDPNSSAVLDAAEPYGSMKYYYQVRSNAVHRGKAAVRDYRIVRNSLHELLDIFSTVLQAARAGQ